MSINRVLVSGNLTRDPELRSTNSGMAVLQFGVAVNDRRRNPQTEEWEDYPNFIECTMFGKRAESVSRFIAKGSKVSIEGKLHWSSWEKDGQKRSKIEVIVDEIELMSRSDAQQPQQAANYTPQPQTAPQTAAQPQYQQPQQYPPQQYAPQQYAQPAQYAQPQYAPQTNLYDEDIPF